MKQSGTKLILIDFARVFRLTVSGTKRKIVYSYYKFWKGGRTMKRNTMNMIHLGTVNLIDQYTVCLARIRERI